MPPLPPSWDGFHPLVVHFPIALLVVAPLFVVLAGLTGKKTFMLSALLLLLLGVISAFVATNTGEAAYDVVDPDEVMELLDPDYEYEEVMDAHKEGTEFARNVFTGAAVLYAVVVILAFVRPKTGELKTRALTHLVMLAILAWGNVLMANAAHLGGELVHIYGVRAQMVAPEDEEEVDEEEESDNEEEAAESE